MTASPQAATYVVEVNEIDQLWSYRDDWACLLAETPDACFFQTLDWLAIYWRHFGCDQRLRTLLVYENEQLAGILPLTVRSTPTRGGAVRTLGYPLDGWGTRYGPIGPKLRTVLSTGLHHVQQTARDWDVLELDWVTRDCREEVTAAFDDVRVRPQTFSRDDISLVDLTTSWDDYWASRDGKHRNNVRRAEKKLAKFGTVETLHYRSCDCDTSDARWELYEKCERVAGQSWQGSSTTGTTLTHERVRRFLREVHGVASRLGSVAIHLLLAGGEPIAFSYNYLFQGTEFGLRMGYDPKFKQAGPGTVLIDRMLQDAFAGDQRLLDMGEGDSGYKHVWRTHMMPGFRFCHYAKTSLQAQALRWKRHWWSESAKGSGVFSGG